MFNEVKTLKDLDYPLKRLLYIEFSFIFRKNRLNIFFLFLLKFFLLDQKSVRIFEEVIKNIMHVLYFLFITEVLLNEEIDHF